MTHLQILNLTTDPRLTTLQHFISAYLGHNTFIIKPLAGDASFRRYFRVHLANRTLVAMDAPPDREDCLPFVAIARIFQEKNLQVPNIIASDLTEGFLLLSDLGDDLYFRILQTSNADVLYKQAMIELPLIQSCLKDTSYLFPDFTPLMQEELSRFREWYLLKHLQLTLTTHEETLLADTFTRLVDLAVAQPQVCVHRDYHSRNLLMLPENKVGILDFQDAVRGPVTYDLVSLIRDCYIDWPEQQVIQWADYYRRLALDQKIFTEKDSNIFMRWFNWMGIQRHLKAIYIFARKFHRDNNLNYLENIPRALQYVINVTEQYPELKKFRSFLLKQSS